MLGRLPTRWACALAVLAVAALTPAVASALTAAEAQSAALAPADMPSGWTVVTPQVSEARSTGGMCNGPNRLGRVAAAGGTELVEVGYLAVPNQGPLLGETITGFPTTKAASRFVADTEKAVRACKAYDAANPKVAGGTLRLREIPLKVARTGDQTFAYREVTTPRFQGQTGTPTTDDIVLVRRGDVVLSVNRLASGTTSDPAQLRTYVRKALAKLDAAQHTTS